MSYSTNIGVHCTLCHDWQIWHMSHSVEQRMHLVPILESNQNRQIWYMSHSVEHRMHLVPILESNQNRHVIINHKW